MGERATDDDVVADLVVALRDNTRRLVELEELACIGTWQWDVRTDAVDWSDEMFRLFGRKRDQFEASYEGYLECLHPDDRDAARANVEQALSRNESFDADYRVVGEDGEIRWLHCRGRAVTEPDGTVARLIGTTQDVTDRKRLEERLAHEALHDDLTGLPARSLLRDRLEHAMQRGGRTNLLTAVFFVDVDGFKAVNDSAGHHVGDAALCALAERLRGAVRGADTVARFGGDEFVIVAEDLHWPEEAARVAGRIQAASSFVLPTEAGEIALTASVGAAVAPAGNAADDVLRNADAAMYRAKKRAGGAFVWFDEVPDE